MSRCKRLHQLERRLDLATGECPAHSPVAVVVYRQDHSAARPILDPRHPWPPACGVCGRPPAVTVIVETVVHNRTEAVRIMPFTRDDGPAFCPELPDVPERY